MGDYGFFAQIWERFKIIWDVAGLTISKIQHFENYDFLLFL
jgi:hypothetical protein